MGFFINPLFGFNFWFTYPIDFLTFLPQNFYLTIFSSSVYPFYMLLQLILVIVACVLIYLGFLGLNKYAKDFFLEENETLNEDVDENEKEPINSAQCGYM